MSGNGPGQVTVYIREPDIVIEKYGGWGLDKELSKITGNQANLWVFDICLKRLGKVIRAVLYRATDQDRSQFIQESRTV